MKQFPKAMDEIDWPEIEGLFHELRRVAHADSKAITKILEVVASVNSEED